MFHLQRAIIAGCFPQLFPWMKKLGKESVTLAFVGPLTVRSGTQTLELEAPPVLRKLESETSVLALWQKQYRPNKVTWCYQDARSGYFKLEVGEEGLVAFYERRNGMGWQMLPNDLLDEVPARVSTNLETVRFRHNGKELKVPDLQLFAFDESGAEVSLRVHDLLGQAPTRSGDVSVLDHVIRLHQPS